MTGTLDKGLITKYLETQIESIDDFISTNGKSNVYYMTMDRDRAILNAILLHIYTGTWDC